MFRVLLSKWRFPLFLIGFYILLNFLIWRQLRHQVETDRQETIEAAVAQNSNLAITLEQYAIKTLKDADDALQLIKYLDLEKGRKFNFDELVNKRILDLRSFSGIGLVDSNGNLKMIYPSNLEKQPMNILDRGYFKFHRTSTTDSFMVSKPVLSKTINRSVIIVSRKLVTPSGSFNGVVAIQIEPSAFMEFYNQANTKRFDIMSLVSPEGITFSRRTGNIQSDGENISKSPLFQNVQRYPTGNYFAKDAIRGIETYFSYRRLQDYPMIATVGRTKHDILLSFYKRERKIYFFGGVISLLICLFLLVIFIADYEKRKIARNMTKEIIQAQEREREIIGHELHDNVNQILTASKLYIELALKDNTSGKNEKLGLAVDHLKEGIYEVRKLSHDLSAPTLGQANLIDSINTLIDPYQASGKFEIDFFFSDYHTNIDKEQALALYRILQEQLSNILKHSEAKKVEITLKQSARETILVIKDDGKGFDLNAKRNGIGLNNIYSRTKVFNGSMSITSVPGHGCTLEVVFPLSENPEFLL
jgi:signal transduction histidine kinase